MNEDYYNEIVEQIEQLAALIQREFLDVRDEMDAGFRDVRGDIALLRGDFEENAFGVNEPPRHIRENLKE